MKHYMYVNPYNEYSCISGNPTEFGNFVEVYDLQDCITNEDEGGNMFFESTNDENGPWVQVEVKHTSLYEIKPYAKGSK